MSAVTYSKFDASKFLTDDEAIRDYLALALEDGDTKTIQLVLRDTTGYPRVLPLVDLYLAQPPPECFCANTKLERSVGKHC